ncbi:hypothetical protein ACFQDN_25410 [Pseudomonas asuensis]|uniref:Uncharacterized protein n=1 Tax=Pseudomonas asuensis TaxID=1825787 RepID=A0ABQ2GWU1_9PSED|nr:hypothetical protein [Pseudomonas asuensis]GGM17707.1 hypothetical protein GCM10009425_30810 [Pseudomonas asuensis]
MAEREKARRLVELQKEIRQYQIKVDQARLLVQKNFLDYTEAYNTLSLLEAQLEAEWQHQGASA